MKGDPERLLSAQSGVDPLERELLGSVRSVEPPEGARDQAWRGIAGQIAAGVVVGATVSSSAATAKAGVSAVVPHALASKVVVLLAAGGIAAGGYWAFHGTSEPEPPRRAPVATSVAPAAPPEVQAPEPPKESAAVEPQESPAKRSGEPKRLDLLKAESGLLTEARAELRSGNAAGAQATLDRLETQFPKGVLGQEREVLAIEVLAARGNAAAAKLRAKAFVRAYPKSPHSAKLSRFLDQP